MGINHPIRALIITSVSALNGYESGASIRIETIKKVLNEVDIDPKVIGYDEFKNLKSQFFDLIVISPFSVFKVTRKMRRRSRYIWFDACDSWTKTRSSRLMQGELKQALALIYDLRLQFSVHAYDAITFISKKDIEKSVCKNLRKSRKLFVVPNKYENLSVNLSTEPRFVFIGDGDYGPNRQAIKFLAKTATYLSSDFKFHIIGKGYSLMNTSLIYLGYQPQDQLYFSSDIHVAPVFAGAGIKNKVAVPLSLGLRVITTNHGANGLIPSGNLTIASNPYDFAEAIRATLTSQTKMESSIQTFSTDETTELVDWLRTLFNEK